MQVPSPLHIRHYFEGSEREFLCPQFRFRPEDRLAPPLHSEVSYPSSRLLLKLRVRRHKRTGQTVVKDAQIRGVMARSFRFTSPADFTFLTAAAFKTEEVVSKTRVRLEAGPYT